MAHFTIEFDGENLARRDIVADSVDEARNTAIVVLGEYLQSHPKFAYDRHWRVDLKDQAGRILLHVVVASVDAPKPIHRASFD